MRKTARCAGRIVMLGVLVVAVSLLTGAKKTSPPDISEIVGAWDATISGSAHETNSAMSFKVKERQTLVVEQTGPTTVTVGEPGDPDPSVGYYENGLLIFAMADSTDFASEFGFSTIMISGSNGKLKLQGDTISWTGDSDNIVFVGKLKAKRLLNPI